MAREQGAILNVLMRRFHGHFPQILLAFLFVQPRPRITAPKKSSYTAFPK
jgi:hypothetical protein